MPGPGSQSWVVLTMGDRNQELRQALESATAAGAAGLTVLVNGAPVETVDAAVEGLDVAVMGVETNVGIPEGRNLGVAETDGEIVYFLDDDAAVTAPDLVSESLAMFVADPALGVVGFRIADPESGQTARRHVPRLRASTAEVSGEVTSFLGGACAIRRACFDDIGGYDGRFFYAMEETDFALRAIDAGWRVWYRGDLAVTHPTTAPGRHPEAVERTARNRVWLARKNLPRPLSWVYVAVWVVLSAARGRSVATTRAILRGTRRGRAGSIERDAIRWRTVGRLSRLGRPPII